MSRRIIIERSCEVCGLYEASDHWDQGGERCDGAPTRTVLSAPTDEMVERALESYRNPHTQRAMGRAATPEDRMRAALTAALWNEDADAN